MSKKDSTPFWDSLFDAANPLNVVWRVVQFIIFGVITATPHLIFNLDKVALTVNSMGITGWVKVWMYLKALMGATFKGLFIGFATLGDTIIHPVATFSQPKIGTIIFSVVVLIFGTLTVYQPLRFAFNVLDSQKGRKHSIITIMAISLIAVVVVISPLSWLINGGETITSGIEADDTENSTQIDPGEDTQSDAEGNLTISIDMLTGDGG